MCGINWGYSMIYYVFGIIWSIHMSYVCIFFWCIGSNTGKTVAVIVGVTAGVGFLIILVLFVRGLKKKDDGML